MWLSIAPHGGRKALGMHRFSIYLVAALAAVAGVSLFGCGKAPDEPAAAGGASAADATADSSGDGKSLTLAVIPKSTGGEFWETVEVGARGAAEELGVEMKWEGAISETEIAEQKKIIENMVNLGVDGIALAPIKSQIGNLGAGCGADAAAAALSVHSGKIPPATNTRNVLDHEPLNVRAEMRELPVNVAVSSVYSLGGQNAALVFRRV